MVKADMLATKPYAHSKQKSTNPLVQGIKNFIAERQPVTRYPDLYENTKLMYSDEHKHNGYKCGSQGSAAHGVEADLPKRYTIYEPMLLLPLTFHTHSSSWQAFYTGLQVAEKALLFRAILTAFCNAGQRVTHVALNAPIVPCLTRSEAKEENTMRSPINLQPLFGDFGPNELCSLDSLQPTVKDLEAAFWVETVQLNGIKQVWAPRWTMFSRGNIREKSRILNQHGTFPGLTEEQLEEPLNNVDVVDFYVGIGYFAFPYLKRGVRRVLGWEINGWSVEALKRGCDKNGWGCFVVRVEDEGDSLRRTIEDVVRIVTTTRDLRCIVFWGDNKHAGQVIAGIATALNNTACRLNIRHCNLGLLPTSQGSWSSAVEVLNVTAPGWLHVHENSNIAQVEQQKRVILDHLCCMSTSKISCEHVEMVKTYAPGVGHYVFDMKLWPVR